MTLKEKRIWAAGFFNGEGSTGTFKMDNHGHKYCRATVSQTDLPVLQQFHEAVEVGKIVGLYQIKQNKPIWAWNANGYEQASEALFRIWPWLSQPKREQALEAFDEFVAYKQTIRKYKRRVQ